MFFKFSVCKYNEFLNTKTFFLKKVSIFKSNEVQTLYFNVLRLQIYTFFRIEKIFLKPFMKKPEIQFIPDPTLYTIIKTIRSGPFFLDLLISGK
ncbi:hypothetical protein DRF59_08595 [Chryseobacterium flavum]|uniref:Uncharacterized protein n=1 Tax=Chryseobacterium flavum TaxID=415851 RepID=A0A3D9CPF9_9FLAO|nr:hypothetical protein DRF59_08595 [Chryseobacterium flavum]